MAINNYSLSGALLHVLGTQFFFNLRMYFTDITISVTLYMSCRPRHIYGTAECCKHGNPDVTSQVTMTTRVRLTHSHQARNIVCAAITLRTDKI
jgi:hypothetical protein